MVAHTDSDVAAVVRIVVDKDCILAILVVDFVVDSDFVDILLDGNH